MKRGEIWTLRDRRYASKARPVIVIQNDAFDNFDEGGTKQWRSCRYNSSQPR